MKRTFFKMHGCGNDYIYFDCREQPLLQPEEVSRRLSDRHKGIGGDGIVLICPSTVADGRMRMFNADGSEGAMCGNAIRCVGKYLYESGTVERPVLTVETKSGIKTLELTVQDGVVQSVTVDMGTAELRPVYIPVSLPGDRIVDYPLSVDGKPTRVTCVSMGNPHCVVFCASPAALNLPEIGPAFEHHAAFPDRINTEFVRVIDEKTLEMRVWERGSGETMACGTGTCAAVVAAVENGYCAKNTAVTVHLRGGDLAVRYTDAAVYMTGPAETVFEGTVEL